MEETVRREGEAAAFELGLYDLHPEVLRLMGRLKFRTSYGQNVLNHSREVAFLAGIMAKELGLNGHVAARAAFLHDIGKAIDRDLQGTHLELGLDFLRKHGESEPVLAGRRGSSHGHRLAVARGDDRAGGRRDFRGTARARAATSSSRTSSGWRSSRTSPTPSRASRRRSRSRPVAKSASSSKATGCRTKRRSGCRRTSRAASRTSSSTRVRSKSPSSVRPEPLNTPGSTTVAEPASVASLQSIRARLPPSPGWLHVGIGDDAAVAAPERGALEVLTTDALVEGVHFDSALQCPLRRRLEGARGQPVGHRGHGRDAAAWRCCRSPCPRSSRSIDLNLLVDGFLGSLGAHPDVTLAGGNITRIARSADGRCDADRIVRPRRVLTRGGARPGDELYVTGSPGAAAAGLGWLRQASSPDSVAG